MRQSYRKIELNGREFFIHEAFSDAQAINFILRIDFEIGAESGCWIWAAGRSGSGYGSLYVDGNKHAAAAHRVAWEMFRGPIEGDKRHLHHKIEEPIRCAGPLCVNPDHLLPLTRAEHHALHFPNPKRGPRSPKRIRGVWSATTCPKGHDITLPGAIYRFPGKNQKRRCRACHNSWQNNKNRLLAPPLAAHSENRTYCGNGHALDDQNSYTYRGKRMCRACHNEVTTRRYHEKRAANGISSVKRVFFTDKTVCKRGHDLTDPANIYNFKLHGQPKQCCLPCKEAANRATYEKWKLAHANDVRPPRRKPGPKPRGVTNASNTQTITEQAKSA